MTIVRTNFWNRVKCNRCGRKHFIITFEHYPPSLEDTEQWYKKCKCGNLIWIS